MWVEAINEDGMPWLINLANVNDLYIRVSDFSIVCTLISLIEPNATAYYCVYTATDKDLLKRMAKVNAVYQGIKSALATGVLVHCIEDED